jgi:hypothetical protein
MNADALEIGIGLSSEKECLRAVHYAVTQATSTIGSRQINLAIVFSSIEFAHPAVLKKIRDLLGLIPVIGCSSLGIISSQGVTRYGIMIMLLALPANVYCHTACVQGVNVKTSTTAGEQLGEKLLSGLKNTYRAFGVSFFDGLMHDASGFISGLQKKLGMSFPLVGGSASDNLKFLKTYVYFDEETYSDAACGMVWGGRINFGLGTKHGWKALGKPRRVTRSLGNIVYEIDGSSASNIYEEYFACDLRKLKKDLRRISIFYPIGIYLAAEKEYLLRNILSIEDNGALIFQGDVPQASTVRLMIGTKESCLNAARIASEEAKQGLLRHQAKFVLVFNSVSRLMLLNKDLNAELEIIKSIFGWDTPLMGLYTYSEQAPLKSIDYMGKTYLHNQSIAVLAIAG